MKFRRRESEIVDINLAPLIDVVFILLLFFVVSTTFKTEHQLNINLPTSEVGTNNEEQKFIVVSISENDEISINGKLLLNQDLQAIVMALSAESNNDKEIPITISADANAKHQSLVKVMDAAGQNGLHKIRILTNKIED